MAETCHSRFCVVCAAGTARRRSDRPPPPPSRLARRPRRLTMLVTSEVSCDRRGRTLRRGFWPEIARQRARPAPRRTPFRRDAISAAPVLPSAAVQASRETHREYAGRRPESLCCSLSSTPSTRLDGSVLFSRLIHARCQPTGRRMARQRSRFRNDQPQFRPNEFSLCSKSSQPQPRGLLPSFRLPPPPPALISIHARGRDRSLTAATGADQIGKGRGHGSS